jgi:atypical dual specificity phosphatase
MSELQIVHRRGSLALIGKRVNDIALKWDKLGLEYDEYKQARMSRRDRDGDDYHITIFTPSEYKSLSDTSTADLTSKDIIVYDVGIGRSNSVYYVIVYIPKLQKLRKLNGLSPCDFHITLGFLGNDCFDVRKDFTSLWRTESECELAIVTESLLQTPGSVEVRNYLGYDSIADMMLSRGYLFAAVYIAKTRLHDRTSIMQYLADIVATPETTCISAPQLNNSTSVDYGKLVCDILNTSYLKPCSSTNIKHSHYSSTVITGTSYAYYMITLNELPRNFSYITDYLCGSSILDTKTKTDILHDIGVSEIITVMETPLSPDVYAHHNTLRYHFFPVTDQTPPSVEQMMEMMNICTNAELEQRKVVVHCMGGVGRTATVLASYLMWSKGLSREDAKLMLATRKTILSASQQAFLSEWYSICASRSAIAPTIKVPKSQIAVELPRLIICVGYPCSGKSTFAKSICELFPSKVLRVNQDEDGRTVCHDRVAAISRCRNDPTLVLDRCNLTVTERKEWLDLAKRPKTWIVFFDVSVEECKWRIVRRGGHETVKKRGPSIIDSMDGMLEIPTTREGVEKVITIRSIEECNSLLCEWGCTTLPISTIPEDNHIIKFPRTRHLVNLGAATRDDLVMAEHDILSLYLHKNIIIEEKIDGANMGITIRNNQLCAQNRSHYVSSSYHPQFKLLDKWIHTHSEDLWRLIESDRYILYGEWVYAKHSIHYSNLTDWFIAFDMYDRLEEKFWSRQRLEAHLSGSNISLIRVISSKAVDSIDELKSLVYSRSQYYDGYVEGIYVRICNDDWLLDRGKIVRPDFLSGNEFWSKGGIQPNTKISNFGFT